MPASEKLTHADPPTRHGERELGICMGTLGSEHTVSRSIRLSVISRGSRRVCMSLGVVPLRRLLWWELPSGYMALD
jgi:hypothetical protein